MSAQSIISLPPKLEMTSHSIHLIEKNRTVKNDQLPQKNLAGAALLRNQQISRSVSSVETNGKNDGRIFYKLTETTFPINENEPLNLRISLQPKDLLSLANLQQVHKYFFVVYETHDLDTTFP